MKPNSTLHPYANPHSSKKFFSENGRLGFLLSLLILTSAYVSAIEPESQPSGTSYSFLHSPLTGTESLRTNLYLLNTSDNSTILADGVLTEYNNLFTDSVTLEDAYKFTNIRENLGLRRYSSTLAVERRPIIVSADTLFFKLWRTTRRHYQFEFVATNLNHPGMQAILQDNYLGTNTVVSTTGSTKVRFKIDANPASANVHRFRIIYNTRSVPSLVPVTFVNMKGTAENRKVSLNWKVEQQGSVAQYEVERSASGNDFTTVQTVQVAGRATIPDSYSSFDDAPLEGDSYYRIKSTDISGMEKYSAVIKVANRKFPRGSMAIYPNPVRGNLLNIRFTNQLTGTYKIRMINSNGQVVYATKLSISSNNISQSFNTSRNLETGIYQVEITGPDHTVEIHKAIIQQ